MVAVNFTEPQAEHILRSVRQRVAMWGDTVRAITRAGDAVQTADRLIGAGPGAMGAEFRPNGRRVLRLNELAEGEPLWIIGDVRGDVLALETVLEFIDEATGKGSAPQIVFLGDLSGGTLGDAACVAIALERFAAAPTRTLVIAGDRELALASLADDAPDERKVRGLAEMPVPSIQQRSLDNLVRACAELAAKLPVAVICPDGLLLAHSAPPRESLLDPIDRPETMESRPEVLRAFAFDRLHPREPKVVPAASQGAASGAAEDFAGSMRGLKRIFGIDVQRMVRSQDAAPEGHRWFRNYGEGVLLTISTMADALAPELGGGRRKPCVARIKSGRIRVVRFEIPEEISITAEQIFPRMAKSPIKVPSPRMPEPPLIASARTALQSESTATPGEQTLSLSEPAEVEPANAPLLLEPEFGSPAKAAPSTAAPSREVRADQIHFERGVRLLSARSWAGARQAFQESATSTGDHGACHMNEAVACLSMGLPGHQDALRLFRGLLQSDAADPDVHFNMGVTYLTNERNPIEAGRAFKMATQLRPNFEDAWWALGLAASLRSDRRAAADAFAKAAEQGCQIVSPSSLEGIIPARELSSVFDALRGRVRYHPALASDPVPLSNA
ncbi:MAG: hypothetical protein K8R92_08080 [Planctomycetes bacterium]|nr:hypothetical protein [Planctomycetota bacterium]